MKIKLFLLFCVLIFDSVSGVVTTMLVPALDYPARILAFSGDMLLIVIALTDLLRNRTFYAVRMFGVFLLGATITVIYNWDRFGFATQMNGLRQPLVFFAALILIHDLFQSPLRQRLIRYFTAFIIVFAILQTPLSIIQFLQYGAGDNVGGTYGTQSGSGLITQLLFLICFYLAVKFGSLDDGAHFSLTKMVLISLLLIPCAINETKISFVLLPAFFFLIMFSRKKFYKAVPFFVLAAVLAVLLNYYYSQTAEDTTDVFSDKYIENYLYYAPTEQQAGDLPRLLRVTLMFRLLRNDAMQVAFGMGYGIFGGGNVLGVSKVARSLYYLASGSRILFVTIWMQGGLIAILSFAAATFLYARSKLISYFTIRRFNWFLLFVVAISWVYNEALLDRVFALTVAYLMIWINQGGLLSESPEEASEEEGEAEPVRQASQ